MIEVKHLSHSYGKFKALNDVSFTIEQGDFIGLIGPNGAGKTTLMKCILQWTFPTKSSGWERRIIMVMKYPLR